jgi:hypothetical protein
MTIRVGPSRLTGPGSLTLGGTVYRLPEAAKVSYFDHRGDRVALVLVGRALHVLHATGEIFGIPARILLNTRREHFPLPDD